MANRCVASKQYVRFPVALPLSYQNFIFQQFSLGSLGIYFQRRGMQSFNSLCPPKFLLMLFAPTCRFFRMNLGTIQPKINLMDQSSTCILY